LNTYATYPRGLERDLEKDMWTEGYKYSCGKMEAAAQNRECSVKAYVRPGTIKLKSRF